MEEGKGRVCVTGGTGFIASWLIKRLLEDGYCVNTMLDLTLINTRKMLASSQVYPEHPKSYNFFNADLSNPDSFTPAIEGCIGVFHVACPVVEFREDNQEILTKITIDAALGILKACQNSKTVKRVVYTSSTAAAVYNINEKDEVLDERFWSDVDYVKDLKPVVWPYTTSKVLTEKAVLEFGEESGFDVVTVLPPWVLGPFICPQIPGSVRVTLALVFGEKHNYKHLNDTPIVHVEDLVRAQIFLLEHPNPKGRYICSPHAITLEGMSEFLSTKYPEFQIPTKDTLKEFKSYKLPALSSKKLMDAGFEFKFGLEETFQEAIQCCKEKGYL